MLGIVKKNLKKGGSFKIMTTDPSRTIWKKNIKLFIYFQANVHSTYTQKCLRGSKVEGNKKKFKR